MGTLGRHVCGCGDQSEADNSSLPPTTPAWLSPRTQDKVVLKADARRAEVAMAGAIDGEEVRRHVIELLEGGEDTYFPEARKYNVTDVLHD